MKVKISLPYGRSVAEAQVDAARLKGVYSLHPTQAAEHFEEYLEDSLKNPIGALPLRRLAEGRRNILLVCDDNTRRTPVDRILPILLKELRDCGIKDREIKLLFASGSHRPMTEKEKEEKMGAEVYQRLESHCHDYKTDLVYKGVTPLGTPIYINRRVDEADFIIGIGSIIPHRYCGWSGGAKIIQPGVCGEETIAGTHLLITKDDAIRLGSMENRARDEINAVARAAGLKFIVNTVLTGAGEVAALVCGDPISAHAAGMRLAQNVCGVKMPKAEIVAISSYPEDLNIWQASKALYAAELLVKPGGTVIMVSPLYEGIGEHSDVIPLLGITCEAVLEKLERREIKDLLSGAAAYAVNRVLEKARVMTVSDNLSAETAAQMMMTKKNSLQEAIDCAMENDSLAKIVCIRDGTEILPIVTDERGDIQGNSYCS